MTLETLCSSATIENIYMSKSAFRPWAAWRRAYYGVGFASFWGMVGVLIYFINFYQPATCFDRIMNGTESGMDCGGECVRICAADVIPAKIVWAKSFEITEGHYNSVAYIENENQTAASSRPL